MRKASRKNRELERPKAEAARFADGQLGRVRSRLKGIGSFSVH
jgi:hypothetical protein